MIISDITTRQIKGFEELSANISAKTAKNGDFRVWFRIPQEFGQLPLSGDPFLTGFLISCMYVGEDIQIDAPVSKRLMRRLPEIQALIRSWYPHFQEISATCTQTYNSFDYPQSLGMGCCFSGGVDSWYSLLKNQEDISHLILIKGMGSKDLNQKFWDSQQQVVAKTSQSFNKKLIEVETNLRRQTDMKYIFQWSKYPWGKPYFGDFYGSCSHGSLLAAVGMCLTKIISQLVIPSSYPYYRLNPWGTNPLLDPLWSTKNITFIHDGCEAERLQKIKQKIAQVDFALQNLRVCHQDHKESSEYYNCCQCEKCLRTMMQLRIYGVLEQASAFSKPLQLKNIRDMVIPKILADIYPPIIKEAKAIGDTELVEALEIALGKKFSLERFLKINLQPQLRKLLSLIKKNFRYGKLFE